MSRPTRFIGRTWWEGSRLPHHGWRKIVGIESGDDMELVDIETSTNTYIANGIISHNSTWLEAEGFYQIWHNPNWRAMAVSVDAESTDHIFGMTKIFEEDLPIPMRRPKDNTNRKEIVFSAPHRSHFISQTAGKWSLGHSFTAQFVHASEVARWENASNQMAGLREIVPMSAGTTMVEETTANGQGGYFYDGFREGILRREKHPEDYTGFLSVFFGWKMFDEYSLEPPVGALFSRDERRLQVEHKLTDAQLYWRQLKLAEMNGDLGKFQENYPLTWREAFQSSGNPVFAADIIMRQETCLGKHFRRVLFEETSGSVAPVPTEETTNCWYLFRDVMDEHDYALGIDTMEGRLSDVKNDRSQLDWDGMMMLDRSTGEYVALYHGRGDQRELARQAFRAARYYNEAYVGPEIPQGMVLLGYFKERSYPYLYNRQRHEDRLTETDSEVLGWRTTAVTRSYLVEDFVVAAKDLAVHVGFPQVLDEMRTFVRDANGKPTHMPGEHDDLLFAAMIALQVHKRCPLTARPYRFDHTGIPDRPDADEKGDDALARSGAIDNWQPGEEEEEDEEASEHTL